ncbi:MAG: response regulator [Bacteroidetes bacterium]|nr:response regulator [Bacteroidota bacterium]
MKNNKITVLYVDDEANNLLSFKANFRELYEVYTAESAEEGKRILKEKKIHVIITDQRMPNTTGIEFLESIIKEYPEPIRILFTGYTDIGAVIEAINKGQVYRYITKPSNMEELKGIIENAYEVYSLREENKELMKSLLQVNQQLEFMLRQRLIAMDTNAEN